MQTTNNNQIHCKVSHNDQFRRFLFAGTEFRPLFSQVQQLLALNKEFVLKYKDIEGDLITLSSDDELVCALNYSDGKILRLVAVTHDDKAPTHDPGMAVDTRHYPCARRGYGRRGGRGNHGGRGGEHCGWGSEMFKAKLISKRDYFKSLLDELEKIPEKTPEQQQEAFKLKKKLSKIESRLEGAWEKREKQGSKWDAKAEKRREKFEKRTQKREKKNGDRVLSEETQTQIALLKSQKDLIKPEMREVKNQIKAKKAALKEAKETGGDPQQLILEISSLKETRKVQKNQVRPLKEKIRELKYASC